MDRPGFKPGGWCHALPGGFDSRSPPPLPCPPDTFRYTIAAKEIAARGRTRPMNEAMLGGGIYVGERATLRIENDNVAVTHNSANGSATAHENAGGGIYAMGGASSQSSVEVSWLSGDPDVPMPVPRGFLLADNVTTGNGGGIALNGTASFVAVEATIRDNAATGAGGGIYLYGNALHPGASAQMTRFLDHLPGQERGTSGTGRPVVPKNDCGPPIGWS